MTETEAQVILLTLTPAERRLVEGLVELMPDYRYDLSYLPPIDPPPEPGLPSALAALRAIIEIEEPRV
jgi:hypothetical protein